uniref:Uncharacterized protein n=1 Tax=Timema poppense TaxID=170557 RepID=A0A7R9DD21_TIMPO|nr:unnamed protein product [Timema poppensis]
MGGGGGQCMGRAPGESYVRRISTGRDRSDGVSLLETYPLHGSDLRIYACKLRGTLGLQGGQQPIWGEDKRAEYVVE